MALRASTMRQYADGDAGDRGCEQHPGRVEEGVRIEDGVAHDQREHDRGHQRREYEFHQGQTEPVLEGGIAPMALAPLLVRGAAPDLHSICRLLNSHENTSEVRWMYRQAGTGTEEAPSEGHRRNSPHRDAGKSARYAANSREARQFC
jgi:hypothetical protein